MPKPIPSVAELYSRISANLINRLGLILPNDELRTVLDAVATVLAGEMKLFYLRQNDIQRNLYPDTADPSEDGGELNRIGQIRMNRQPFPPTDGYYLVSVSGVAGTVLRAQLTFQSNDTSKSPGNLYILDDEYILTGSGDTITLRSLDAGPDYALIAGDGLTVTEPVIGLDENASVTSVTTAPTAGETTPLYRRKVLDTYLLEPQGGAKTDYRLWSDDAAGVERVFIYVKNGDSGVVQVYVEATVEDSTDGFGTPSDALIDAVEEVIQFDPDETLDTNERGRRPAQAILEMLPVSVQPVDVAIYSLETNNTDIETAIRTNLVDYLFKVRPFIDGADLRRDKNDILTSVKVQSVVTDTIGNANSFIDFKLYVDGVELNTYTFNGGEIPYLRDINYL